MDDKRSKDSTFSAVSIAIVQVNMRFRCNDSAGKSEACQRKQKKLLREKLGH
jgi:hypothetical protein